MTSLMAQSVDPESWEWPDEITDPIVYQMAEVALPLLLRPERWIHRRVEQIRFIDRQTIHRQVSVDFTLPTNCTPVGNFDGRDVYLAPLFLLRRDHPRPLRIGKEQHWWAPWRRYPKRLPMSLFSDVTFVDQVGKRLPLITRRQSTRLASVMLQLMAVRMLDKPLSDDLRTDIAGIAIGNRERRKVALESIFRHESKLSEHDRAALRDSDFAELACMIATHVPVICLFTDGPPGRSIVKLSYVEPLAVDQSIGKGRIRRSMGWKSENLAVGVNEIGAAGSHHIEIAIPDDLRVNYVSLAGKRYTLANVDWSRLQSKEKDCLIRQVGTATSGNVYLSELPFARRMGRVSIKMRVRRSRFLAGALVASIIITGVLAVFATVASHVLANANSDAAVAALLLLPSVVATYIARPGEHLITARMLRWARFALVLNAALPFLAVLIFFTTPDAPSTSSGVNLGGFAKSVFGLFQPQNSPAHGLEARWALLAYISAALTCLFIISNIWPRPHGKSYYAPLPEGEK